MTNKSVPLIVLSSNQEDTELINRVLRSCGVVAHCHWTSTLDEFQEALEDIDAQLAWIFCDHSPLDIESVLESCQALEVDLPLIAVSDTITEARTADLMLRGAADLVSPNNAVRMTAVAQRELSTFRLRRALNTTLHSATQYQQQLTALTNKSKNAIAHISEGILVHANSRFLRLIEHEDEEFNIPLMDILHPDSHEVIKGALLASQRGHWSRDPLRVTLVTERDESIRVSIVLEAALYEGEPVIRLIVPHAEQDPEDIVEQAISTDPYTGLFHRQRFIEAVTERTEDALSAGVHALALIRIDNFGAVIEQMGPLDSEEVLVELGALLRDVSRSRDIYGRFGGTVFAIWLERGTLRDLEAWSQNFVTRIAKHDFRIAGKTLSLTCSVGVADFGQQKPTLKALLNVAHKATELARKRGGNQAVLEATADVALAGMNSHGYWLPLIRSAFAEQRFRLHSSPIANLNAERRLLFDTYLRMLDRQDNEIPASSFMPIAEQNKLAPAIDRWVIDTAIKSLALQPEVTLLVRLGQETVVDRDFMPWMNKLARTNAIATASLCIQLTEELVNQFPTESKALVADLHSQGFMFAIEHFGIGKDPMRTLESIAPDFIKLDGSLMEGISENPVQQAFVTGFVQVAKERGIETIAERIEDANTLAVLFQLGIGHVQGHYIQEPEVILEDAI